MSDRPPAAASGTGDLPLCGVTVAVTGVAGQLGGYLRTSLEGAGARVVGLGHAPSPGVDLAVDIVDAAAVREAIARARPGIVIHAAAFTDVDGAERDPARAMAVNGEGSRHVAEAARAAGAYLLAVGTDFVFPGDGGAPYAEDATPAPVSSYGRSKLAGERAVLETDPAFAVARTAWVYGGRGKHFPRTVVQVLRDRGSIEVVDDETGCPTFAGDLAGAIVAIAPKRPAGVLHLVNDGAASRFELAREVAGLAGFGDGAVRPISTEAFLRRYPLPARRPPDSRLLNRRAAALGVRLRPWSEAVRDYVPRLAAEMGVPAAATVATKEEG